MVKHPQSEIGYARDGVLYKRPTPRPSFPKSPGSKKKKERAAQNRQNHFSRNKTYPVISKSVRFDPRMESIKNASKRGELHTAVKRAYHLSFKVTSVASYHGVRFKTLVQLLFSPDIENRSAIYYAAHTGNHKLVEAFLALLIVMLKKNRHQSNCDGSFQEWLHHLGYPPFFSPANLKLCVLNGLNDQVKSTFLWKKYTMKQILNIAEAAIPGGFSNIQNDIEHAVYQVRAMGGLFPNVKNKKRLPTLNVEDDFDPNNSVYDDDYINDESYGEGEVIHDGDCVSVAADSCEGAIHFQHPELNEACAEVAEFDVDKYDDHDTHVHLDHDDNTELSFSFCESDSVIDDNDSEWDIMSEAPSVVSFNSATLKESYAQVLARKATSMVPQTAKEMPRDLFRIEEKNAQVEDEVRGTNNGDNEETSMYEDAEFFVNGVKGARGGRRSTMFKGNQKTQRRCRCRYCRR